MYYVKDGSRLHLNGHKKPTFFKFSTFKYFKYFYIMF